MSTFIHLGLNKRVNTNSIKESMKKLYPQISSNDVHVAWFLYAKIHPIIYLVSWTPKASAKPSLGDTCH